MHTGRRTIAVISPSGIPDPQGLEQGLALIRSWGHDVVEGKHLRATWRYMGGTGKERSDDLCWALREPGIDVVWVARGGFGIQHCLAALPEHSVDDRVVIGCSDVTALFQFLYLRGHRQLVHGPWVDALATGVDDATRDSVRKVLDLGRQGELMTTRTSAGHEAVRGPLLGGNLTMQASLCGSPWQLRANGAILMLEDVTEHAFRMDRSLLQLRNSGALDGVRAVVLGEFTRCHLPANADYTADQLVAELLQPLGVPVVVGAPFGHGRSNLAWPYGREARLQGNRLSIAAS
jgi:muramoyltetrapeptide carboxypeptidase